MKIVRNLSDRKNRISLALFMQEENSCNVTRMSGIQYVVHGEAEPEWRIYEMTIAPRLNAVGRLLAWHYPGQSDKPECLTPCHLHYTNAHLIAVKTIGYAILKSATPPCQELKWMGCGGLTDPSRSLIQLRVLHFWIREFSKHEHFYDIDLVFSAFKRFIKLLKGTSIVLLVELFLSYGISANNILRLRSKILFAKDFLIRKVIQE